MTAKEFNRCLDALPNDRNALEKIYKFMGANFDGLNQYLMGFEKNNITYYFNISCFGEDLTEFIGLLVKDLQN